MQATQAQYGIYSEVELAKNAKQQNVMWSVCKQWVHLYFSGHNFSFSAKATSLFKPYVCLCLLPAPCLCNKFLGNVTRRHTSSDVEFRLVLISSSSCWQNSTPFWCKSSLCMIKIDNFRTYHELSFCNLKSFLFFIPFVVFLLKNEGCMMAPIILPPSQLL